MAEYSASALQTVLTGQSVIFTESPVPCNRGLVIHRDDSGIFTLRGPGCNCNQCYARYRVTFSANVAVPEGGVAATGVSLAIAQSGEALSSTTMISTPSAVSQFNNVATSVIIFVPRGCCVNVGVVNNGTQAESVQNANITIERIA